MPHSLVETIQLDPDFRDSTIDDYWCLTGGFEISTMGLFSFGEWLYIQTCLAGVYRWLGHIDDDNVSFFEAWLVLNNRASPRKFEYWDSLFETFLDQFPEHSKS